MKFFSFLGLKLCFPPRCRTLPFSTVHFLVSFGGLTQYWQLNRFPNLPWSNNMGSFSDLCHQARGSSHSWARLIIWGFISSHSPTPGAFKERDERPRALLLGCGSQLEPHEPMDSGSDGQDIPLYWEEIEWKMQVWAHFFLVICEPF